VETLVPKRKGLPAIAASSLARGFHEHSIIEAENPQLALTY
jgi:hypothetical protein